MTICKHVDPAFSAQYESTDNETRFEIMALSLLDRRQSFPYRITKELRVIREESLRHQDSPHQALRVIGKQ